MGPRRTETGGSPLEAVLHYRFADPSLLEWALTHRSLPYEHAAGEAVADPRADNEQLEFLGDAVLGLVTTGLLLRRFPASREGELTRLRASLVSRRHLAGVAARLDLGAHLRLGRGEERTGGRRKPALLSNALEAVLGAIYLDAQAVGADPLAAVTAVIAREVVDPAMPDLHSAIATGGVIGDHKSALQEHLQATGAGQPRYVVAEESGPDHQKRFRIEVHAPAGAGEGRLLASAEASTKKEAQQEAARLALAALTRELSRSTAPVSSDGSPA